MLNLSVRKDEHYKKVSHTQNFFPTPKLNLIALRMAKTLWSFGHSECNRLRSQFVVRGKIMSEIT